MPKIDFDREAMSFARGGVDADDPDGVSGLGVIGALTSRFKGKFEDLRPKIDVDHPLSGNFWVSIVYSSTLCLKSQYLNQWIRGG